MTIRPNTARTHSGTPSTPIFKANGELRSLWVSISGWEFYPIDPTTDPDLANSGCSATWYCTGQPTAVGMHPETHATRTICTACMHRIVNKVLWHNEFV